MKLCRFALNDDPKNPRHGLYREGRFFETDGANPVAIHEADKCTLLAPIVATPSIRAFEVNAGAGGYRHLNPTRLANPGAAWEMPEDLTGLDFECRMGLVVAANGALIQPEEAHDFMLGFGLAITLHRPRSADDSARAGVPGGAARDIAHWFGPVIATMEDLPGDPEDPTTYVWNYRVRINGVVIEEGSERQGPYAETLVLASQYGPVVNGELLLGPAFDMPDLDARGGTGLSAGDIIEFEVQGIGRLVANIA